MANKDTFEAFISILQDKIINFSDSSVEPILDVAKEEAKDKFNALIESKGYVSKKDYDALEALARRLEKRLEKLEGLSKKI
jgi:hypothetical protein